MRGMGLKIMKIEELEKELGTLSVADKRSIFLVGGAEVPGYKAVYNLTKERVEAVLSDRYCLIQHVEAVKPVVDAIRELGHKEVRARVMEHRGRVWMDITFPEIVANDGSEGIEIGIRVENSIRGDSALKIGSSRSIFSERHMEFFIYRKVCSNGATIRIPMNELNIKSMKEDDKVKLEEVQTEKQLGVVETVTIRHLGDQEQKKLQVQRIVASLVNCIPYVENVIRQAQAKNLTIEQAKIVLQESGFGERLTNKIMEKYAMGEQTIWGAFNAATDVASHDAKSALAEERIMDKAALVLEAKIPVKGEVNA